MHRQRGLSESFSLSFLKYHNFTLCTLYGSVTTVTTTTSQGSRTDPEQSRGESLALNLEFPTRIFKENSAWTQQNYDRT